MEVPAIRLDQTQSQNSDGKGMLLSTSSVQTNNANIQVFFPPESKPDHANGKYTSSQSIMHTANQDLNSEVNIASNWMAFNATLYVGPSPPLEGTISGKNIGPFYATTTPDSCPFPLTQSKLKTIRETLLRRQIENKELKENESEQDKLLQLQRVTRSELVNQYLHQSPFLNAMTKYNTCSYYARSFTPVVPTRSFGSIPILLLPQKYARQKVQTKRDIRAYMKERRRKMADKEDVVKRKQMVFNKYVLNHREEFLRFHKNKRQECTKKAKALKQWLETIENRKEKDDLRAENKRLQALRENDMESYMKLVQETKNVRLKFLLNQTDNYIATVHEMIRSQREDSWEASGKKERRGSKVLGGGGEEDEQNEEEELTTGQASETSNPINKAKRYYEDSHRYNEKVSPPQMLRGGDLKEYQIAGLQWLVSLYNNNLNGILADEMGLGKTIQTLSLLAYIMEHKQNHGPFLVLVPLSTLSNWVNETTKWVPSMIKVVYRGTPTARKQIFRDEVEPGHYNVLFTTYEYAMKDKSYLKRILWQYIIVDEGHRMKNAQSKFAQILGTQYKSKHRILLTGTPLQNNLPELWSLLNFLLPTIFNSMETFDEWFNKPFASFKNPSAAASVPQQLHDAEGNLINSENEQQFQLTQEERMLIVHRLHEVLRPFMLRRVKSQVLDQLPDKVEMVLRCEMSGWQKQLYRVIHHKALGTKDSTGNITFGPNAGVNNIIMQLRKACNHPYLFLNDWLIDEDIVRVSGKFELLDRMLPKLKAAGHRILMFSQMTQVMTILEKYFEMRRYDFLRLDGSTAADEREKRMFQFNDPNSPYFIFLLSTRAGGLGLNLATADIVILFDSDWNPMMDMQAQDRAHRIGQKNEVRVFRLITTSAIEERILSRASDKRAMTGLVVEAGKFNKSSNEEGLLNDRKEMMEALLKEYADNGEADGEEGEEETVIPDDSQLNVLLAIHDGEAALYDAMDKEREERRLRAWVEQHGPLVPLESRLMDASSVPSWICEPTSWQQKYQPLYGMLMHVGDSMASIGDVMEDMPRDDAEPTGPRKRKSIAYTDGMTETQYLKMVESADIDEAVAKSRKSSSRRNSTHQRSGELGQEEEDSGVVLTEEISQGIIQTIGALNKIKHESGYLLYDLFIDKPDKNLYPDYYHVISQPVALKTIQANLRKKKYTTSGEVLSEFNLICENAKTYNDDSSAVYHLSLQLKSDFSDRLQLILSSNGTVGGSKARGKGESSASKKVAKGKKGKFRGVPRHLVGQNVDYEGSVPMEVSGGGGEGDEEEEDMDM